MPPGKVGSSSQWLNVLNNMRKFPLSIFCFLLAPLRSLCLDLIFLVGIETETAEPSFNWVRGELQDEGGGD